MKRIYYTALIFVLLAIGLIVVFTSTKPTENNNVLMLEEGNNPMIEDSHDTAQVEDTAKEWISYTSEPLGISLEYPKHLDLAGGPPGDSFSIGHFQDDKFPSIDIYSEEYWESIGSDNPETIDIQELTVNSLVYNMDSYTWGEGGIDDNGCPWSHTTDTYFTKITDFYVAINVEKGGNCKNGIYVESVSRKEDIDLMIQIIESIIFIH